MVFQPGLGAVRRLVPRVMRRPVRRLVPRPVRRLMGWPVRRVVRLAARLGVWLMARPLGAMGRTVRLWRRPVPIMVMRRPGTGFRFFHEDGGRSGRSHAHEGGEAKEKGTAAYLLRLGRGVHRASPKY